MFFHVGAVLPLNPDDFVIAVSISKASIRGDDEEVQSWFSPTFDVPLPARAFEFL